jgi:hypothetical protein
MGIEAVTQPLAVQGQSLPAVSKQPRIGFRARVNSEPAAMEVDIPAHQPSRERPLRYGPHAYRPVLPAVYSQPSAKALCGKSKPGFSVRRIAPVEALTRYVSFGRVVLS